MNVLRCSVVIPTRNRAGLLARCLGALAKQTLGPEEIEIIVVDDGSTDGTGERAQTVAQDIPSKLRVLKGGGEGPAAARNLGWRAAEAPIVLFTDDDCEPSPGWAQGLVDFLEVNLGYGGAGGLIRGIRDCWTARYIDGRKHLDPPGNDADVDYLVSANAAYRRRVLELVDGFDETFPRAAGEDPELSFRVKARGIKLAKASDALVLHNHPRTLVDLYRMNRRYGAGAFNLARLGYNYTGTGRARDVFSWFRRAAKEHLLRDDLTTKAKAIFILCEAAAFLGLWRGYCCEAKCSAV